MDVSGLPPSLLQRIFPGDHTFTNQNKESLISRILRASSAMRPQLPMITIAPPLTADKPPSAASARVDEAKDEDRYAEILSKPAASELFQDVDFSQNPLDVFYNLVRISNKTNNEFVLEVFSELIKPLKWEQRNLPGMPKDEVFDSLSAFVNPEDRKSCVDFIGSQVLSILLRCQIALKMDELQKKHQKAQERPQLDNTLIFASIKQAMTLMTSISDMPHNEIKEALIAVYWLIRSDPKISQKLPRKSDFKSFSAVLIKKSTQTFFDFVSRLKLDNPPANPALDLPGSSFTYYNVGSGFSELELAAHYLNKAARILADTTTLQKSPLLQICLLFVLSGINTRHPFPERYKELCSLTTRIYLGKDEFEESDLTTVGQLLVDHYPKSPVVFMALLLLVVEHLEKSSTIEDPQEVVDVLFLLNTICPYFDKLPEQVDDRMNKTLTALFSRYDAFQQKENPQSWALIKTKYDFDKNLKELNFPTLFKIFDAIKW